MLRSKDTATSILSLFLSLLFVFSTRRLRLRRGRPCLRYHLKGENFRGIPSFPEHKHINRKDVNARAKRRSRQNPRRRRHRSRSIGSLLCQESGRRRNRRTAAATEEEYIAVGVTKHPLGRGKSPEFDGVGSGGRGRETGRSSGKNRFSHEMGEKNREYKQR